MKRPVGTIFAAILLALFAAVGLLTGGFMTVGAASIAHAPTHSNAPVPPPQVVFVMILAMGLIVVLLAVWAILTVIGLFRLKNWARYSILTIGALLAFFGIVSAAVMAFLPAIIAASAQQPAAPPNLMQGMVITLALFYTAIAAIGIWWLVYFNLRSVKACFLPNYAAEPNPYLYAGQTAASLATPGGLPMPPPPMAFPVPPPGALSRVPTSIIVIAALTLLGALCCAGCAFLPFPGFFGGVILHGILGHLLYVAFAAFFALIGIGLLRLSNTARIAFFGITGLNLLNFAVLLTPWGRTRQMLYNQQVAAAMNVGSTPPFQPTGNVVFMATMLVLTLVMYGTMIFLIERHRALFRSAPR